MEPTLGIGSNLIGLTTINSYTRDLTQCEVFFIYVELNMQPLYPQRSTVQIGLEIVQGLIKYKRDKSIPNFVIDLLDLLMKNYGQAEAVRTAQEQLDQMVDFIDVKKLARLLFDQDKTILLLHGQLPESLDEEKSIENYMGQAQELIDQLHANPDYDLALHTKFLGQMEKTLRDYIVKNTKVS